jgi:hypothetical protein
MQLRMIMFTDTNIEQIVVLICTPDNFFQRFIVNGDRFRNYKSEWLKRVDKYYCDKNVHTFRLTLEELWQD